MEAELEAKVQASITSIFDDYCLNQIQRAAAMKFIKEKIANRESSTVPHLREWILHKINNRLIDPSNPRQRGSPDIIPGLTAHPWWDVTHFPWIEQVEEAAEDIRRELLLLYRKGGFQPYRGPTWASKILAPDFGSQSHDSGDWNVFYLYLHGIGFEENLEKCPTAKNVIQNIIPRHYDHAFFSAVNPGTHIVPHHGPTNKKLRLHLPLIAPEGSRLRACDETREFVPGKAFVFDDSFDHEAWHEGETTRVNLIIDFWHPDLTDDEVKFLKMLQNAKMRVEKGLAAEDTDNFFSVIERAKELRPDDNSWWSLSEEDAKVLSGIDETTQ